MGTLFSPQLGLMPVMVRNAWLALGLLAVAGAADARPVSIRVADASGRPVANAVVVLRPIGGAARMPAMRGPYVMSQKGMQFSPAVLIVPVGADVNFPNLDSTKHH